MLFIFIVANVELQQDHHHFVASAALSQLVELCNTICNKSITLGSLDIVKKKRAELKKLCDAVNSGSKNHCMSFSQVEPHLDRCIRLQSTFLKYREHISTLLGLCGGISNGMLHNYTIRKQFNIEADCQTNTTIYKHLSDVIFVASARL